MAPIAIEALCAFLVQLDRSYPGEAMDKEAHLLDGKRLLQPPPLPCEWGLVPTQVVFKLDQVHEFGGGLKNSPRRATS